MASYPIKNPIVAPSTMGSFVDLDAPALASVTAPEAGELVYVGDGTKLPFATFAPGVVVLWGRRSNMLHVLGWIDRGYVDTLRGQGVWGWTGGVKHDSFGDVLIPDVLFTVNDFFSTPATYPRPQVAEGQVVGKVAPARSGLRWAMIDPKGLALSPLVWAQQQGLPAVPQRKKPQPPPAGGGGELVLLALIALGLSELS